MARVGLLRNLYISTFCYDPISDHFSQNNLKFHDQIVDLNLCCACTEYKGLSTTHPHLLGGTSVAGFNNLMHNDVGVICLLLIGLPLMSKGLFPVKENKTKSQIQKSCIKYCFVTCQTCFIIQLDRSGQNKDEWSEPYFFFITFWLYFAKLKTLWKKMMVF